ncbi:MAG TPA: hypothetical protein VNO14_07510 [Blastocatellia bacterium]|nr:hypothetical protein [Blastocatellia bacterium]
METRSCYGCGRVNSPAAKRCIWCGLPIIDSDTEASFEITSAQLDYLSGIERLDEPIQVRVMVGPSGVEVIEMLPGSRRVLIPASDLIGAEVEQEGSATGERKAPRIRRGLSLGKINIALGSAKPEDEAGKEGTLIIKYSEGSEVRAASFQGRDSSGLASINRIAQTIALLIRWRKERTRS